MNNIFQTAAEIGHLIPYLISLRAGSVQKQAARDWLKANNNNRNTEVKLPVWKGETNDSLGTN